MKKSGEKTMWKVIVPIIITVVVISAVFLKEDKSEKLQVELWDNVYNENNIKMYYGENDDKKIMQLYDVYKLKEIILTDDSEIDRVLKVVDIVNRIVEFDDVASSKKVNGYDILQEKGELKKVSQRDMAIIARDLMLSIGVKARIGEFKTIKSNNYVVVEYWSDEHGKWIMIDFRDRGYITMDSVPCSAIEVIKTSSKNIKYTGKTSSKEYIKDLKKITETYSINIDNTITREKSNSYITYIKEKKYISINYSNKHIPPTIFTENEKLFQINPSSDTIGEDEKAYIILMKKENEKVDGEKLAEKYVVGGFKDSKIIDKYFIKHNNGEFESVKKYYELELVKGDNTIEISLDGKKVLS
ncbi:MAG: hypothetical protein ACRC68_18740, partial [Clostridium sp.]